MQARLVTAFLLLSVALLPELARAQAFGLTGGLNRGAISGDKPKDTTYGSLLGLQLGAFGNFRFLGDTQLRVELAYSQRGTQIGDKVADQREPIWNRELRLDYLSIPVLLKVDSKGGRLYTAMGLDLAFLMSATLKEDGQADVDVKDQLLSTDLAVNFGFGGLVRQQSPQVGLEVRYTQSLYNLGESFTNDNGVPARFRSGGLQFLVSVGWPWGGLR